MNRRVGWCIAGLVALGTCVLIVTRRDSGAAETVALGPIDELLTGSNSTVDAARRWLERHVEDIASPGEYLDRLVAQASAEVRAPTTGISIATRDPETGDIGWQPVDEAASLPAHLVILAHGLDEPGAIWDDLAPILLDNDLDVARLVYPNDQHIPDSAVLFYDELRALHEHGVETIDLVGHSMGGLVSREMLTNPDMYASDGSGGGRVPGCRRLITLGTPHRGSPWAGLQSISEVREYFVRWVSSDGSDGAALLGFLRDGRGQAADDLAEGSPFLRELNSRPHATGVRMTAIRATITPGEVNDIIALAHSDIGRTLLGRKNADEIVGAGDDLVRWLGDGVVPYESAVPDGVTDVIDLRANHRGMVKRTPVDPKGQPPAIEHILERLLDP